LHTYIKRLRYIGDIHGSPLNVRSAQDMALLRHEHHRHARSQ